MCNGKEAPGNRTKSKGNSGRRLTKKLQNGHGECALGFLDCTPASDLTAPGEYELA